MNQYALSKINELEQLYCKGCLIKQVMRESDSKSKAHQFCIKECSVGLKIKTYGNQLQ